VEPASRCRSAYRVDSRRRGRAVHASGDAFGDRGRRSSRCSTRTALAPVGCAVVRIDLATGAQREPPIFREPRATPSIVSTR